MKKIITLALITFLAGCSANNSRDSITDTQTLDRFPTYSNSENSFMFESQPGEIVKDPKVVRASLDKSVNKFVAVSFDLGKNRGLSILPFEYQLNKNGSDTVITGDAFSVAIDNATDNSARWAPTMMLEEGEGDDLNVHLYYAKGVQVQGVGAPTYGVDWSTFRIFVSTMTVSKSADLATQLKSGTFTGEKELFTVPEFTNPRDGVKWDGKYGVIDIDIFKDSKTDEMYAYYVVVVNGIAGTRWHEQFIRARKLQDYRNDAADAKDLEVYNGYYGATHEGVLEAPRTFNIDDSYVMLISSRPSDRNQYIWALKDSSPLFSNSHNRAGQADDKMNLVYQGSGLAWEDQGVGHQDMFTVNNKQGEPVKYIMIYQGLGSFNSPGFRYGLLDVSENIKQLLAK